MSSSKPILIAYDGSDGAKAAIKAAGQLFPRRSAQIVSIWHSVASAASASLVAIPPNVAVGGAEQLDREGQQKASTLADEGTAAAKDAGLDAAGAAVLCQRRRPPQLAPGRRDSSA